MGRPCRCCKGPKCCCSPWVIDHSDYIPAEGFAGLGGHNIPQHGEECELKPPHLHVGWHLSNFQNNPNGNLGGSFIFPPSRNCVPIEGKYADRSSMQPFTAYKIINLNTASYVKAQLIGDVERTIGDKDLHQLTVLKMKDNSGNTDVGNWWDMGAAVSACCKPSFCDDGRPLSDYDNMALNQTFTRPAAEYTHTLPTAANFRDVELAEFPASRDYGAGGADCRSPMVFNYINSTANRWEGDIVNTSGGGEYLGLLPRNHVKLPFCIKHGCLLSEEFDLCSNYCDSAPERWAQGTDLYGNTTYDFHTVRPCYRSIFSSSYDMYGQIVNNIQDILYYDKPAERKYMSGFHLSINSDRCNAGCAETVRKNITLDSVPYWKNQYTNEQINKLIQSGLFTNEGKYPLILEPGCYVVAYNFSTRDSVSQPINSFTESLIEGGVMDRTDAEQMIEVGGRSSSAVGAFNIDFQSINDDATVVDTCPPHDFVVRVNSRGYPNNYGKIVNKDLICAFQEDTHPSTGGLGLSLQRERNWRYYYISYRNDIDRCCPLSSNTYDCSRFYRLNVDQSESTAKPWPEWSYYPYLGPPASGMFMTDRWDAPTMPDEALFCNADNIYHSDLQWEGRWVPLPPVDGMPVGWGFNVEWTHTGCRQSWQ